MYELCELWSSLVSEQKLDAAPLQLPPSVWSLNETFKKRHGLGSERRPSRAACNQKVKVLNCGASNMRSSSVSHWVSLPCPPFSSGAAEQKQQKCWKAEVLSAEVFRVWRRSVGCSCRTGLKCPGLHCRFSASCSGDAVYSSLHTSF